MANEAQNSTTNKPS